jgi:hypothetical protein
MRGIRLGQNFTVFLLFFGIALLEAFRTASWLRFAFWCAIAAVFLWGDAVKRRR